MSVLIGLWEWSLSNPFMVFLVSFIVAVALATDKRTIPVTQNANLAFLILSTGAIFLFWVEGGFESILMQVASGAVSAIITVFVLNKIWEGR
jgi:hypothetical protein